MQHATFIGDLQTQLKELACGTRDLYDERLDMNPYVGWETVSQDNPLVQKLFTKGTVTLIQQKVGDYLTGVDPNGRRIIPSERIIVTALFGVFRDHVPTTGDIYGKYTVVDQAQRNDYAYIVDKTISLLFQGIRDQLQMEHQNESLTPWTALYGDFNEHKLRQHPPIKVNQGKRPDPFLFHMRY